MLIELSLQNFIFISTFIDTFGNVDYFGKAATVAQHKSEFQKNSINFTLCLFRIKHINAWLKSEADD